MNSIHGLVILMSAFVAPESTVDSAASTESLQSQFIPRSLETDLEFALNQFEKTDLRNWTYRVSRYENEEGTVSTSLESFDPRRAIPERWQLEQLNEQFPTPKQQRDFQKRKAKAAQKEEETSFSIRLRDLIQPETLTWTFEDGTKVQGQFKVFLSRLGEDASKKLQGTVTLNKQQGYIETLNIVNTEAFSPMFSATINDFSLTFRFENHNGAVLLVEQSLAMQGTFAWVTEINEVSTDRYFDYQHLSEVVKQSESTP